MKYFWLASLFFSSLALAKPFNIDNQDSGTYLKANYGTSSVGGNAYTRASGAQTEFKEDVGFNWGGEIGFMFPKKDFNIRLGLEVINPQKMSQIEGTNAAGVPLMSVESAIYGYFPVLHLEFFNLKTMFGRGYLSFGGGYGQVKIANKYKLTTAGSTQYPGITDYTERASQYTYLLETAFGYEFYFANSTTINFDLGYRYARAGKLERDNDATTFNGAGTEGSVLTDSNGSAREINLGGLFIGLGLRFYFNF